MKIAVLIATFGRKALLAQTLTHLERQARRPDLVVIAAPDETHVPRLSSTQFPTRVVLGATGLTAQRNTALAAAIDDNDILVFFDDDFLPAADYLQRIEGAFKATPEIAALTGHVIADGAQGPGISFDDGVRLLGADARGPGTGRGEVRKIYSAYGCNMAVRSAAIGPRRFDERLPLYSWQEDVDFTSGLNGDVMFNGDLRGVHLGTKSGRVSGVRFGYSQIVNPIYLMRKGTLPAARGIRLMAGNVLANMTKAAWPESYIDRRGRLKGNLIAAAHALRGHIDPEHVLKL